MAGFQNDTMVASNVNFTTLSGVPGKIPTVTVNGQLLIGSTALPNIQVGSLVSPNGSITIGYSSPNITLELAGGTLAFDSIMVDTTNGSGVNPVVPTAAGLVTFTGGQYISGAFGTRVFDINSPSPNTIQFLSQISSTNATTLITKNGICHFDSSFFSVDANGFVTSSGTGFIQTITGNTGGAETPLAGNFNILGTGSITVAGSAHTETVQLTGLTNHAVQVGAGTATLTQVVAGADGTVLVGGSASDPAFSTTISSSVAGDALINLRNTNTAANANCLFTTNVANDTSGDPYYQCIVTSFQTWSFGADNSASNQFAIAASTSLGTTDVLRSTIGGAVTKPLQPAFLAFAASANDVTGAGASYQYGTAAMTTTFDQGTNFNTNGTFTAPVTGKYDLKAAGYLQGCTINTGVRMSLVTSNRTYTCGGFRTASSGDNTGFVAALADMDAADTAVATIIGFGEAGNTDDLLAGTNAYFCGSLIC